jgi:hypothetical protein
VSTERNRRRKRESNRRWREKNLLQARACNRAYYYANHESQLARAAARVAAMPDYVARKNAEFRASNPNYLREYRARRKLRFALQKFAAVCASNRALLEQQT